ncbi:MAG: hypothetical protein CM1200mP29_10640 [Verrucomicrobiota bacterium]|nr:MAG: hypothetical protein CM1200mP29_10640 [Verrucomicrobiota bacterium]
MSRQSARPRSSCVARILKRSLFGLFLAVAFQFQLVPASAIPDCWFATYLIWQFTHSLILKKYGRKREVEGTSIYVESYTSNNLKLIALLLLGLLQD